MASIIVGSGEYTYERIRIWGQAQRGREFEGISAVAVDSQDRVYVFQRSEHPVLVFDRDGKFLYSWGEGVITEAHGIHISPDDHVWLVDRQAHQVLKFTTEGKLLMALGNRDHPSEEEPFNNPADIAVAPTGELYVCDGYANSRVHKFTAEGKHLMSWGTPGRGPGQFVVPHSIWVDKKHQVYVGDRENNRIQVFTADGAFVAEWTNFYRPTDIYVDAHGHMYVTDLIPRVSVLDLQGKLLARGQGVGTPHGIWGDSRGDFYVASPAERKIEKYVRK